MEVIGSDVKHVDKRATRSKVVAALEASVRGQSVAVAYLKGTYYWCGRDGAIKESGPPEGSPPDFNWTPARFSPEPPKLPKVDPEQG